MAHPISPELRKKMLSVAVAAETDFSAGLDVTALAEHAEMSEKHFQRCFRAVCGEPPKRYLRRIRLQAAAYLLRWSDTPVTQIGVDVGFGTATGFTKAFTKVYGHSPQAFRARQDVVPYLWRAELRRAGSMDLYRAQQLSVRLESVPTRRIAFRRYVGSVEGMAGVWTPFGGWLKREGLLHEQAVLLGIYHDYWDQEAEGRYRYDAAVVVPDDFVAGAEVNTRVLPGATVAMTEFEGSLEEADRAWRQLVDLWLPASGYRLAASYAYDRYPPQLMGGGILSRIQLTLRGIRATLCLPVCR